jgi:hypothetical protein
VSGDVGVDVNGDVSGGAGVDVNGDEGGDMSGRAGFGRMLRGPLLPALVAVLVVGGSTAGAAALLADGKATQTTEPSVPPPLRNAVWTVDAAHDAYDLTSLSGAWVTDAVVVRGGVDGLHAVKRADGSAAWDLPAPGDGGFVCAMSPATDGGIGVLSFGAKDSGVCGSVAAVDVATGHVLWTVKTAAVFGGRGDGKDADGAAVAVDGGMVLVDSAKPSAADPKGVASVVGLAARSGAVKWRHSTTCDHSYSAFAVGGGRVAVVEACGGTSEVLTLDSGSGAVVGSGSSSGMKAGAALVAMEPLVVADDPAKPTALGFLGSAAGGPGSTRLATTPVAGLDGLYDTLGAGGLRAPRAATGSGVVCVGRPETACWDAGGRPLVLHGMLDATAHFVPVDGGGSGDGSGGGAASFLTLPTREQPRATLCRVGADGAVTVEAELSLPVSKFLADNEDGRVFAYGDAKDLVLVAGRPAGSTVVVDVR